MREIVVHPTLVRRATTEIVPAPGDPIRVMIVDDSAFFRGIVGRWIDEEAGMIVAASHPNGRRAVADVTRSRPDVVILDTDMPEMDGISAVPPILAQKAGTAIVMAAPPTHRDVEMSLRALALGAADFVLKPEASENLLDRTEFRADLVARIRVLGRHTPPAPGAYRLRPVSTGAVRAIAIGSSAGGPQALMRLFADIGSIDSVPVFVAQHMPPTFTAILAEHIGNSAGSYTAEGVDGEAVRPGRVYVAPGGRHMLLAKASGATVIRLADTPPVNFQKPAVDPLFLSVAEVYGSAVLGIVLSGAGGDGARGATAIADAGGTVFAQDEATSVAWGMPRAAIDAGACSEILPLAEVGPRIAKRLGDAHA